MCVWGRPHPSSRTLFSKHHDIMEDLTLCFRGLCRATQHPTRSTQTQQIFFGSVAVFDPSDFLAWPPKVIQSLLCISASKWNYWKKGLVNISSSWKDFLREVLECRFLDFRDWDREISETRDWDSTGPGWCLGTCIFNMLFRWIRCRFSTLFIEKNFPTLSLQFILNPISWRNLFQYFCLTLYTFSFC